MDNLFVFVLIFKYFKVPLMYQVFYKSILKFDTYHILILILLLCTLSIIFSLDNFYVCVHGSNLPCIGL